MVVPTLNQDGFFTKRKHALDAGHLRYYTGKVCPNGHFSERFSKTAKCLACVKLQNAIYRIVNKERHKMQKAAYALRTKERKKQLNKVWNEQNKDRQRINVKAWHDANLKSCQLSSQKWKKANPERVKFYSRSRQSRKRTAGGSFTMEQILNLLRLQQETCVNCKVSIKFGYHIDHVMPVVLGGTSDIRNLQLLCQPCNSRKHASHPIAWALKNGRLV